MNKIAFKNPKGGTVYLAKVGFDWGGFWGIFLGGLPFFLRKMNILGAFCLGFLLIEAMANGLESITNSAFNQEELSNWEKFSAVLYYGLLDLGLGLYLGFRGGKITARHYVEEGYECITKDEALLARARTKWSLEV